MSNRMFISLYHVCFDEKEEEHYFKKMPFVNRAHALEYSDECIGIKKAMDEIKERGGMEELPTDVFRFLLHAWVDRGLAFAKRYGKAYVPLDIRRIINKAERELHREVTDFGPDLGVIPPENHGHYLRML